MAPSLTAVSTLAPAREPGETSGSVTLRGARVKVSGTVSPAVTAVLVYVLQRAAEVTIYRLAAAEAAITP